MNVRVCQRRIRSVAFRSVRCVGGLAGASIAVAALAYPSIREGDLYAYAALGHVLADMGRDDEAEIWLREAIARGANGATAMLALFLYASGREDEAQTLKRRVRREARDAWPPV